MFENEKLMYKSKNFLEPRTFKESNRQNDQSQVLTYGTKSLVENKTESAKKIVLQKFKILKKGGKIIKKPYKVVIKKTLAPSGTQKQLLTE